MFEHIAPCHQGSLDVALASQFLKVSDIYNTCTFYIYFTIVFIKGSNTLQQHEMRHHMDVGQNGRPRGPQMLV